MNLATLLQGPAVITHRGVQFHSRGGAVLAPQATTFPIETDAYGPIDNRHLDNSLTLALTPVGVWTAAVLDVLYRWRTAVTGQFLTPVYDVDSIDTVTDEITLLGATGPRKGCPVRPASFGTLPAVLTENDLYYAGVPNAAEPNVITLHATEADAIAGTNPLNFADDGDGDHTLVEQEPLIIHTYRNRKITFHNAALSTMPPIAFSTTQTLLGQVQLEAFRINDKAWSVANSLYTVTKEVLVDVPPDGANIPTQEYGFGWGAAPWDDFKMRGAATLTPQLQLSEITGDASGIISRMINSVSATAAGAPHGFSEQQLLDILGMQGGTAGRGKSRTRADLTITGTGVHCILRNAAAQQLPQTFSATDPRAGELAFVGSRGPEDTDAFYVGIAAP